MDIQIWDEKSNRGKKIALSGMPCTVKNHCTILKINNSEWPWSYIIKYTDQVHQWNSYKQVIQSLILEQLTIHLKKK